LSLKSSGVLAYTREPVHGLGLAAALENTPFRLSQVVHEIDELRAALETAGPAVVLYDCAYDSSNEQLVRVRAAYPHSCFVALVPNLTSAQAMPLQESGVQGVIRRDATVAALTACLERVSKGNRWFDPDFEPFAQHGRRAHLTKRETELVRLVLAGMSNKEIGSYLCITEGTVKVYLSKLFRKVDVRDRLELAMYGVRRMGLPAREPTQHGVNQHGAAAGQG
jgi:two-component system, NarL family, nitrate/nitrite response regulator NarL